MNLNRSRHMRRRWIKFDTRAKAAAGNIGRCTSEKANDFWRVRAYRWQRLADMQHEALKALIGLNDNAPRITSADTPPSISWRDVPEPDYASEDEMEALTL